MDIKTEAQLEAEEEQLQTQIKAALFGMNIAGIDFKHERVGTLLDGRVQVKITCENEWLEEHVSVITNDEKIGYTPFFKGHLTRITAQKASGEEVSLYGYFSEEQMDGDDVTYLAGICQTLTSGTTHDFYGKYQ